MSDCFCGSGLQADECCAKLLAGGSAPTAEALMRSRYTAYAQGDIDYIERTCAPEALGEFNRLEVERFIEKAIWGGLEILRVVDGGADDQTGLVEFIFSCSYDGEAYQQHEVAYFCRKDGAWLYEKSDVNPKQSPDRVERVGRNEACPCGSHKKFKKCCGA
ncbi:MAG: YchJ family metal-binding protein [Alphaproteobacteria bacterium]|nr:YchJ family metal-binding protein [Alphaproteobacteria bacterium]